MMLSRTLVILLCACLSSALVTPHRASRELTHHFARVANVVPNALPLEARSSGMAKSKRLTKRCKPKLPASNPSTPANPEANPAPEASNPPPNLNHPQPTPTPKAPAPKPPAPKPTTTHKPAPPPPPPPPPPPKPTPGMPGPQTGDGTFYSTGLDACGDVDHDSDFIAAASHALFDSFPGANGNPNQNPICGKKVRASFNGKSVVVAIKDRCGGCSGFGDLDFSPSAFKALADPGLGRIRISWDWA